MGTICFELLSTHDQYHQRGIHDVRRAFTFASNPEFIFHDSPGFETGDETQLKEVQQFIRERAKATDPDDQLHAIWYILIFRLPVYCLCIALGSVW